VGLRSGAGHQGLRKTRKNPKNFIDKNCIKGKVQEARTWKFTDRNLWKLARLRV